MTFIITLKQENSFPFHWRAHAEQGVTGIATTGETAMQAVSKLLAAFNVV